MFHWVLRAHNTKEVAFSQLPRNMAPVKMEVHDISFSDAIIYNTKKWCRQIHYRGSWFRPWEQLGKQIEKACVCVCCIIFFES